MRRRHVRGFLAILAVLACVLLASALAAPVISDLVSYPFPRIFRRLVMAGTILTVLIFVRFRRDLFVRVGMAWTPDSARYLRTGFATGLGALSVLTLGSLVAGHAGVAIRQLTVVQWVANISESLAAAILIGCLEEFVLRGFVFTGLRDVVFGGRALPGMIVTSVLYTLLHFLNPGTPAISADPGFTDGVTLILAAVGSLSNLPAQWPEAVGLLLFGMVLNWCVVQAGSLYPAIGLHAGCVAFLRLVPVFIRFGDGNRLLWGTTLVYDGALAWGCLLAMGLIMSSLLRKAPPPA